MQREHIEVKGGTQMSENQNRGIGDLSKYDVMTTEELEEILRLDAQAPEEQESDTEMILYVMEVLAARKRNNGHTGKTALEAYESFKQNYPPEINNNEIASEDPTKTRITFPHWLRSLTATAAVLAILLVGSVTAQAFGLNIWEAVVRWTQETFQFGEWGNPNVDIPYASIQEAIEKGNVPRFLVPTWIPDGYEMVEITVDRSPVAKKYGAKYTKGDQFLTITVRDYLDNVPVYVEQSDGLVEEYEVAGVTYYLFENYDVVKAVWIVDSYECYISGNVTIEELKQMIDSIVKG